MYPIDRMTFEPTPQTDELFFEEKLKLLFSNLITYCITQDTKFANSARTLAREIDQQVRNPIWHAPSSTGQATLIEEFISDGFDRGTCHIFILLKTLELKLVNYTFLFYELGLNESTENVGAEVLSILLETSKFPAGRWFEIDTEGSSVLITELSKFQLYEDNEVTAQFCVDYPVIPDLIAGFTNYVITDSSNTVVFEAIAK